ncbi:MAG: Efflux pump membrane transporter BepG [Holosporales bacterium]
MSLSEVCIRRPVFAWVLTLIIVVLGLVAFQRLPLQQYPTMREPAITIEANGEGMGPEIVESQMTKLIEEQMTGLEGLDFMQSSSKDGKAEVTLMFKPSVDIEVAANEVRDRIARINQSGLWPHEVLPPSLRKTRNDDRPVVQVALISDDVQVPELYDYAENEIKKRFEAVKGVGHVEVTGSGLYVMRIFIDPTKLAAFSITTDEVINKIRMQNFERPIGKLKSFEREFLITAVSSLEKEEEFNQIVVSNRGESLVRIKDIGYAKLETKGKDQRTILNGKPGVQVAIYKHSTANPIEIAQGIRNEIPKIEEQMPKDRQMFVLGDTSEYIERSIKEVYRTIFEATLLVIVVVFFFLKSFRASVIPLVTIPVSLIGTFAVMHLLGFSINNLTLMAMVLAIGLVVDDAIVVLENIYRYIEDGMKPLKAAFIGIKEITAPVIAMTITLAAVYAPVSFASGRIGKFMGEFSVSLAVAVIISGFAALTLSPMMCSRLLRAHQNVVKENDTSFAARIKRALPSERWLENIDKGYQKYLKLALEKRNITILIGIGLAALGAVEWTFLPKIQEPKQDIGFLHIRGHAPFTSTIEFTSKYIDILDALVAEIPEVEKRSATIKNAVSFDYYINLANDRERSSDDIKRYLDDAVVKASGLFIEGISTGNQENSDSSNITIALKTTKEIKDLKDLSAVVGESIRSLPFVENGHNKGIRQSVLEFRQDYKIKINNDKALSLNIDPRAIADTIETLIRGKKANTFKKNNRMYDVMVEVEEENKRKKEDILRLLIRTGSAGHNKENVLLPLQELIRIEPSLGLPDILHYNRQKAMFMYIPVIPGTDMLSAINQLKKVMEDTLDPNESSYDFTGATRQFLDERDTMMFIFGLAIIFIYLVLSAQFESWRDPFIIMLSVPLSLAGAMITLVLIKDGSINMYSIIGMITLIGLITKHGILMVQFANELQMKGEKIFDAIYKACSIRLRPILMTTAAMVLGAIPLALATGPGCESRRQIGWVIVGGMTIGTLFTLFVLPAIYSYLGVYKHKPLLVKGHNE